MVFVCAVDEECDIPLRGASRKGDVHSMRLYTRPRLLFGGAYRPHGWCNRVISSDIFSFEVGSPARVKPHRFEPSERPSQSLQMSWAGGELFRSDSYAWVINRAVGGVRPAD
jgi:hypothetical protein